MAILSSVQSIISQNTSSQYLTAFSIFLTIIVLLYVFKKYAVHLIHKLTKRTQTDIDDYALEFIAGVRWPVYVLLAIFLALRSLVIPPFLSTVVNYLLIFSIIYYFVKGLSKVIDYVIQRKVKHYEKSDAHHDTHAIKLLANMLKVFIWIIAFLLLLSNLGVNITSLIAGLGIGGIAIAFALQNVLTDLFSAFTIYLDKPFKVGDFIIIGNDMGIIKKIGLKSTRIEALQGQEIVISNQDLTSSRINNYKVMQKRRIVFSFGVTYDTPLTKLKRINDLIKDIFSHLDKADLDRVHFKEFGASSLNFEVVYFLKSSDYTVYMDTQQQINWDTKQAFEKEHIHMAFPTQTVYLKPDENIIKSYPPVKKGGT